MSTTKMTNTELSAKLAELEEAATTKRLKRNAACQTWRLAHKADVNAYSLLYKKARDAGETTVGIGVLGSHDVKYPTKGKKTVTSAVTAIKAKQHSIQAPSEIVEMASRTVVTTKKAKKMKKPAIIAKVMTKKSKARWVSVAEVADTTPTTLTIAEVLAE